MQRRHTTDVGDFVGEDGLASGRPRNAHVIARDAVTCLVRVKENIEDPQRLLLDL